MDIIFALIQGIVQGLTEFLPVSSSGHLAFIQNEFGINGESGDLLLIVLLHLGTLISVLIYYRRDILDILTHLTKRRIVPMVIIATVPLAAAVLAEDAVSGLAASTQFIGAMWLITGIILIVSDYFAPKGGRTEQNMRWPDAVIVGIVQAAAVLPGLSRSGTTITAGTLIGLERKTAVKYSFYMSIPAILGANVLKIKDAAESGFDAARLPQYAVGLVAAAVSGYFAIRIIDWIAERARFRYFGIYCIAIGIAAEIISFV